MKALHRPGMSAQKEKSQEKRGGKSEKAPGVQSQSSRENLRFEAVEKRNGKESLRLGTFAGHRGCPEVHHKSSSQGI